MTSGIPQSYETQLWTAQDDLAQASLFMVMAGLTAALANWLARLVTWPRWLRKHRMTAAKLVLEVVLASRFIAR